MPYMPNNSYREIPFCIDTPYVGIKNLISFMGSHITACDHEALKRLRNKDFYTYIDLKDIPEKCDNHMDDILRCRTIGILQSLNGRYYLTDFNSSGTDSVPLVQVSVVYLQSSPQSTVIPYPVQIFGLLQWKNRPVLYAKILQVMYPPTAIRLKNALCAVTSTHLAETPTVQHENEEV